MRHESWHIDTGAEANPICWVPAGYSSNLLATMETLPAKLFTQLLSVRCMCRVTFSGGSQASNVVSSLSFVLSTYALNGTWLGLRNFTSQLQLCGAQRPEASAWRR